MHWVKSSWKRIAIAMLSVLFLGCLLITGKANADESRGLEESISANNFGSVVRNAACSHTYSWVRTKQPTCTAEGVDSYRCKKCYYVASTRKVAALGHSWKAQTSTQPTCTTGGTYVTKCTRCGSGSPNGNGYIPATGHSYNRSSASCTEAKKCTKCNYVAQQKLGHNWNRSSASCTEAKKCTRCSYVAENAKGHSMSWKIKTNSTCTVGGTDEYKCSTCGYVQTTRSRDPLGHNLMMERNMIETCPSYHQIYCQRCGKYIRFDHNLKYAVSEINGRAVHAKYCEVKTDLDCGWHEEWSYCRNSVSSWVYYRGETSDRIVYFRVGTCRTCGNVVTELCATKIDTPTSLATIGQDLLGYVPVLGTILSAYDGISDFASFIKGRNYDTSKIKNVKPCTGTGLEDAQKCLNKPLGTSGIYYSTSPSAKSGTKWVLSNYFNFH